MDVTLPPGADRLRLVWPDLLGLARGKYVSPAKAGTPARWVVSTYIVGLNREIHAVPGWGGDTGYPDVLAVPDAATIRPGWEAGTAIGIADARNEDGTPVAVDPRHVLRLACDRWREAGLEPQLGFEMELYLMEADGRGGWRPLAVPGHRVYGTGPTVDPGGVLDEITRAADASGLHVDGLTGEFDPAQFEVNLHYAGAIEAADGAFLFRVLAREVAARHGLLATFLGRPAGDRVGSGLHVNISFCDSNGANALDDPAGEHGLSAVCRHAVAGLLDHHESLCGVVAPTVNAYKRLGPGMLSGFFANWGLDNRTVAVRIPSGRGALTRIESRIPDGAANPYLAAAALLQACRLGVEAGVDPAAPQEGDGDVNPNTDRGAPRSLAAALDALDADQELAGAIGRDVIDAFLFVKRAEWERFRAAVTDWELAEYLPFF